MAARSDRSLRCVPQTLTLKKLLAESELDKAALKDLLGRKW